MLDKYESKWETTLKQTHKLVHENLKKWLQQTRHLFSLLQCVACMFTVMFGTHTKMKSWPVFLKQTICLTCLQSEHVVRIVKRIDGHLPREISCPIKYLIDREVKITAKLSSIHYRRSLLFQGGLDIPCEVTVTISVSIKRNLLMQHYEKMVHEFYCQPKNETIMGSLIENINVNFDIQPKKKKKKRDTGKTVQKSKGTKDIQSFFQKW